MQMTDKIKKVIEWGFQYDSEKNVFFRFAPENYVEVWRDDTSSDWIVFYLDGQPTHDYFIKWELFA